ncbi:uncharacterized protein LOC144599830 isoform X2 [Rhinoraja longicauda]
MWAKLMLIVWQHFIYSSANDSAAHETAQTGFSTDVSTILAENSSPIFSSSAPLTPSLTNAKARSSETNSPSSFLDQTVSSRASYPTSHVLSTAASNLTLQNSTTATAAPNTTAHNATSNSSVIAISNSPNVTNNYSKEFSATDNPLTNSTAQPTSQHTFTSNSSLMSRASTSRTNSITAINVSIATFTKPDASTTPLSPSSIISLLSKSPSNNSTERENRFNTPSNAAFVGVVMYLKKRRVFYSRLQEDHPIGSWSNYNNPVFEDS